MLAGADRVRLDTDQPQEGAYRVLNALAEQFRVIVPGEARRLKGLHDGDGHTGVAARRVDDEIGGLA